MIYGDILREERYPTSISESLGLINEEYIEFKPAAKGADSASIFFMIGANDTHLNSPRYKAAGDKKLFQTKNCYEIDYKDNNIHHKDSSTAKDAKLTKLGDIDSEAFGRRYYIPLDINAKYPQAFGDKELVAIVKADVSQFSGKGKPISGRVRCEYDPDAPKGSRYSLVEMDDDESYDDYKKSKYGYTN